MNTPAIRGRSFLTRPASPSGFVLLALVTWLLATGRWGSYVGVPHRPIYISELAIGCAAVAAVIERWRRPPSVHGRAPSGRRAAWVLLLCLLTWAVLRLVTSPSPGLDSLRDFAPYGYAIVALGARLRPPPSDVVVRVIFGGLMVHTAWVAAAHYSLFSKDLPALGRTSLFTIRADFDATICGVTAAWCVYLAYRHRRGHAWLTLLPFAAVNLFLVFRLLSRAGLIATFVSFLFLGLVGARPAAAWAGRSLRNTSIATLVLLALVGGVAAVTATSATGDRLLSTFDFDQSRPTKEGAAAAGGTTKARLQVYGIVIDYAAEEPSRLALGVGFGPDFLEDSGAAPLLEGTTFTGVRAPHNILVNTVARLGVVGALLHLAVLAMGALLAAKVLLGGRSHSVGALYGALAVALPVAASVGVILESPFGAIPYFWCYGWLASRSATPGHAQSSEQAADKIA